MMRQEDRRKRLARGAIVVVLGASVTAACASAPVDGPAVGATGAGAPPPAEGRPAVPAGFGTLRQEEVTVSLRSGPLLIKVTPLDEVVTRLLAPDTYQRLRSLAEAHRAAAERVAGAPALFLVSFFSHEANVSFTSEDLQLAHLGRLLRPVAVVPVSAGFGAQRLQQQETQLAVYIFDHAIDYDQPITVRYGMVQSDAWTQIIPRLEVERGRVRARTGDR